MTVDIPARVLQRVLLNASRDPESGCLISGYSRSSNGYAQIGWWADGRSHMTGAHRVVWTSANGQIPERMHVHHICFNRGCIELSHLQLLPNFENARRTRGRDWPLGTCVNGHDNSLMIRRKRQRECGVCRREGRRKAVA